MKKTYPRRRRAKRRFRADVLNFSLCGYTHDIHSTTELQEHFTCQNPFRAVTPIVLGGQSQVSMVMNDGVTSITGARAYWLTDRAERGGTVGNFRFKHFAVMSPMVTTEPNHDLTFSDVIYNAIVKMEYDLDAYRSTGVPLIADVPNIVRSSIQIGPGATDTVPSTLSDLTVDVLWRDIARATTVDAQIGDSIDQGTVDVANFNNWAWTTTPQWSVVKVKRRLKEDEGLFWVTNIVSGMPQSFQDFDFRHLVQEYVYGIAAARIR